VGTVFFPLDKELDLPSTGVLPHAHRCLVRLGSRMPFAQAQEELLALQGIQVSSATLRRQTLQAGEGSLQVELQRAHPLASCCEEVPGTRMIMSNDGAMVSLRGKAWGEVKLVVLGHVQVKNTAKGPEVHSDHLSYFARLTTAETFTDQASAEIRRRGLDRAKEVCAVQDGAEWITRMVQAHRADALCILDFPHAAERIAAIARFLEESAHALPASWLQQQLHQLKHEGPEEVLKELRSISERVGRPEGIEEHLRYLSKRVHQMQYPSYREAFWPIGSGIVESGQKVVMQARLKGAGMHWKPENVNPMLALCCARFNSRWDEAWQEQQVWNQQRRHHIRWERLQKRKALRESKRKELRALVLPPLAPVIEEAIPPKKSGRTPAQQRWGRQTFSPRLLRQGK
jgi:hypothetical protein